MPARPLSLSVLAVLVTLALAALAPSGAHAQDEESKPLPTDGLVERLAATDATFGFYLERKNIGTLRFVGKATVDGGAELTSTVKLQLGEDLTAEITLEWGPDLQLRRFRERRDESGQRTVAEMVATESGKFRFTRTRTAIEGADAPPDEGGPPEPEEREVETVPAGVLSTDLVNIVVAHLTATEGARFRAPVIQANGDVEHVEIGVSGRLEVAGRAGKVTARSIHVTDPITGDRWRAFVADGKTIRVEFDRAPIVLLAGTEEECGNDLPRAPETDEQKKLRAVATRFLEGLTLGEADKLDETVDFGALHARVSKQVDVVRSMSLDEFRTIFVEDAIARAADVPPDELVEQVESVTAMLDTEIEGERGEASFPGGPGPMEFRKDADGKWKLVFWAPFGR